MDNFPNATTDPRVMRLRAMRERACAENDVTAALAADSDLVFLGWLDPADRRTCQACGWWADHAHPDRSWATVCGQAGHMTTREITDALTVFDRAADATEWTPCPGGAWCEIDYAASIFTVFFADLLICAAFIVDRTRAGWHLPAPALNVWLDERALAISEAYHNTPPQQRPCADRPGPTDTPPPCPRRCPVVGSGAAPARMCRGGRPRAPETITSTTESRNSAMTDRYDADHPNHDEHDYDLDPEHLDAVDSDHLWAAREEATHVRDLVCALLADNALEDRDALAGMRRRTCRPCQSWADHVHDPLTGEPMPVAWSAAKFSQAQVAEIAYTAARVFALASVAPPDH